MSAAPKNASSLTTHGDHSLSQLVRMGRYSLPDPQTGLLSIAQTFSALSCVGSSRKAFLVSPTLFNLSPYLTPVSISGLSTGVPDLLIFWRLPPHPLPSRTLWSLVPSSAPGIVREARALSVQAQRTRCPVHGWLGPGGDWSMNNRPC